MGNQWDYVAIDSAAAGTYSVTTAVDMSVVPTANILRTLNADGNKNITPDVVAGVCTDSPENSVILGSR